MSEPLVVRNAVRAVIEAAGDAPGRVAFAERGLRAIARLLQGVDEQTLRDASRLESDDLMLMRALIIHLGNETTLPDPDAEPLFTARMAGFGARQELLRAGNGLYTGAELATLLGVSRQTIDSRRRSGKLLGLPMGDRSFGYPRAQVVNDAVIEGLPAVLQALAGFDPWSQLAFLLSPNTWLDDQTPLDALRQGEVARVAGAAEAHGEQIAA